MAGTPIITASDVFFPSLMESKYDFSVAIHPRPRETGIYPRGFIFLPCCYVSKSFDKKLRYIVTEKFYVSSVETIRNGYTVIARTG